MASAVSDGLFGDRQDLREDAALRVGPHERAEPVVDLGTARVSPAWSGHTGVGDLGFAAHGGGQERNNRALPHIGQEDQEMISKSAPVAAAVGLAVLLGACTPSQGGSPAPGPESSTEVTPAPSPTETVTPEPDPADVEVPGVGEFVTEVQAQAARDAGLGVFVTADGGLLVIDPGEPLPEVVIEEFRGSGANAAGRDDRAERERETTALNEVGDRVVEAGRIPIFIHANGSYDQYGNREAMGYTAFSPDYVTHTEAMNLLLAELGDDITRMFSHAEALAMAQQVKASHATPDRVEIIDTTQW